MGHARACRENSVAQRIDVGARDLRATRLAWSPPEVAQRIAMQHITTQAGCSMCRVAAGARPTRHARAAPMSSIAGGRWLLTARRCSCSRRVAAIYAQHHHLTSFPTQSPAHLLRTGVDSFREADSNRPQQSDGEGEVRSDRCPIPAAPTHRSRCKGCKPPEQGPAHPPKHQCESLFGGTRLHLHLHPTRDPVDYNEGRLTTRPQGDVDKDNSAESRAGARSGASHF